MVIEQYIFEEDTHFTKFEFYYVTLFDFIYTEFKMKT